VRIWRIVPKQNSVKFLVFNDQQWWRIPPCPPHTSTITTHALADLNAHFTENLTGFRGPSSLKCPADAPLALGSRLTPGLDSPAVAISPRRVPVVHLTLPTGHARFIHRARDRAGPDARRNRRCHPLLLLAGQPAAGIPDQRPSQESRTVRWRDTDTVRGHSDEYGRWPADNVVYFSKGTTDNVCPIA
jgi:hypothetical protein